MRLDQTAVHAQTPITKDSISTLENSTRNSVHQQAALLQEQGNKVHKSDVETVVNKINEFIEPLRTNLKFQFHEKLNEYYVTVVNPLTDEVIKEIPPKKMLDMYAEMAELMGIMIDQKI